jgi:hypothetical protein
MNYKLVIWAKEIVLPLPSNPVKNSFMEEVKMIEQC